MTPISRSRCRSLVHRRTGSSGQIGHVVLVEWDHHRAGVIIRGPIHVDELDKTAAQALVQLVERDLDRREDRSRTRAASSTTISSRTDGCLTQSSWNTSVGSASVWAPVQCNDRRRASVHASAVDQRELADRVAGLEQVEGGALAPGRASSPGPRSAPRPGVDAGRLGSPSWKIASPLAKLRRWVGRQHRGAVRVAQRRERGQSMTQW